MARRPRTSKPSREKLDDALAELATSVVGEFLLEPEGRAAYRATRTKAALRKAAKTLTPDPLDTFDVTGGGQIALLPTPLDDHFMVLIQHAAFRAAVAVHYDMDDDGPAPAAVVMFDGDVAQAFKQVRTWIDELDDDLDDDDGPFGGLAPDDLVSMLMDRLAPSREALPANAAERVRAIANRTAAKLRKNQRVGPNDADMAWMDQHPDCLDTIVDLYVAACTAKRRDDALIASVQAMLGTQLEFIRYQVERGWDWANDLVKDYEQRILALADSKVLQVEDWSFLPTTFSHARLPVSPEAAEAFAMAGASISPAVAPEALPGMMRDLIGNMAAEIGDPFELIEAVMEVTAAAPPAMRAYIAHELALSSNPVAREAVPPMLLDPAPEVRQAAAAALEQTAVPDTMAPVSLRRIIAVRNWVPVGDRPAVDRAIRKAREKGVEIAPWPPGADVSIVASMIDGVGAQSLMFASRTGRTGLFAMILLKNGVTDTTCMPDEPRRDIKQSLDMLRQTAPSAEVDRGFADAAVQHAIAANLAAGTLPPAGLLNVAERIGASDWKDRALDPSEDTARLFAELTPEERTEPAIATSLRRSETWTRGNDMFATWFEDSKAIHDLVAGVPRRDSAKALRLVLDEGLEKLRGAWAERLLLLTLWARATSEKPHQGRWKDFLILAHCLSSGRKLADIPLMRTAAQRTIAVARGEGW